MMIWKTRSLKHAHVPSWVWILEGVVRLSMKLSQFLCKWIKHDPQAVIAEDLFE